MKRYSPWLIGTFLLVSSIVSAASRHPRPYQHQKTADKQTSNAEQRQPEPTVPLAVFNSSQAALFRALDTLHAEQEAHAKENNANYEPWHAPSVLVQIGLLIVGALYTYFAWKQWTAIREQARLTEEALIADKRAFVAADNIVPLWDQPTEAGHYNWRLRPRYRNTGSTPTRDLRSHVECEIRNTPLPAGHNFVAQNTAVGTGMRSPHARLCRRRVPRAFFLNFGSWY